MTVRAFIGLGANIGDPVTQLEEALELLDKHADIDVVRVSSFYQTAPVGVLDQPDFTNACCEISTSLQPLDLLSFLQEVEQELGRIREKRWGPRTLDLDILLFGEENIKLESLIVPHPRMHERAFVIVPLAEIAPDIVVRDGKTAAEWKETLPDAGDITKRSPQDDIENE
ncbi:2-amino-4-hydroxy-6-hydroxymethyldihydropteridine diphosphokinase [Alkalicoccus urumqiensis]|uniref:2-amino-4-hydroxy-6-hydroxymethyldihydropteridine diphosphokinase n=1 Tax=Alkalicoccus urumqiensis TaxID=1548213 RepID=A0A2P6MDS6_ALKUR|nr:2-amino-4-hydroxy-6-hydroxymethyldihydropteridine diphosphokinase [Alkalicoccus urumqiensis]PRO64414.1 2-amino-4-hydroxy-6-hydroxymethyldihydropteridine diphosphokinase [Alkalicoccus urumqiensis]